MLRDVSHSVTDGLLSAEDSKGVGTHLKIGVSPIASTDPIIITGGMSAARITALLGLSPLADAVMDSVQFGANRILCLPVAPATPGTSSQVTKAGTGTGTLTVSGSPHNAFDVLIRITGAGALNTAAFTYSVNGGYSFAEEHTIPTTGSFELPGTGITVKFAAVDTAFVVGDSYHFTTTAPTMTNGDVLKAIEKLRTITEVYEFVHIVGESVAALWQAVSIAQVELAASYKKPLLFMMEAGPTVEETAETYLTRLKNDRKKVQNYNIQVVPCWGLLVKLDGTTQEVNLAGVLAGLYARTDVQVSVGKTNEAAKLGIPKTKLLELRPAGIAEITEELDLADFVTFRGYDGFDKYFVYHAKLLSPADSDYHYAEDIRVLNKIIRETRRAALLLLSEDIDMSDVQGELDAQAKFIFAPLQHMIDAKEISDAEIIVPEESIPEFTRDGTMRVKIRYVSRGYIREILVDLGRTPATT